MNEAIRELFLTDWVHEATTEEIVKKLVENDERHKEINRLQQELQRKDNIINELKEWLDKEKEIYKLELTKKNAGALSYSLPIKSVYRQVLDKIEELEKM